MDKIEKLSKILDEEIWGLRELTNDFIENQEFDKANLTIKVRKALENFFIKVDTELDTKLAKEFKKPIKELYEVTQKDS